MEEELLVTEHVEKDRGIYEVGYHVLPMVGEEGLGKEVTTVRDAIESQGGSVFADEYPKHLDLAYPMVKVRANKRTAYHSAYFGWMKFEATPGAAEAIGDVLKKNEHILRFLLVKTVRESTLAPKKTLRDRREELQRGDEAKAEPKVEMTEEELDKTIEELVIN